ncbi:MAG: hypothetical protein CMN30_27745 [Sandaracinus sp.]|nr:hypothetical protein [Sandaracinus sp.]|tara:strand:- start:2318 stop:2605 length:288 start_codon:yes stop_codon:yes gene_type:complete
MYAATFPPSGWENEVVEYVGPRAPHRPAVRASDDGSRGLLALAVEANGGGAALARTMGVDRSAPRKWAERGVPADRHPDLVLAFLGALPVAYEAA